MCFGEMNKLCELPEQSRWWSICSRFHERLLRDLAPAIRTTRRFAQDEFIRSALAGYITQEPIEWNLRILLAFLCQQQCRSRGELLCHRADRKHGVCRRWDPTFNVGEPISLVQHNLTVDDDGDDGGRELYLNRIFPEVIFYWTLK